MRLAIVVLPLLVLLGCQTAMTPGSVYRQSGSWADLIAEPTFDVGSGYEATFYTLQVPHYDADGHGYFDVPVVFSEQLAFAPVWLFSGVLKLTGGEEQLRAARPAGGGIGANSLWLMKSMHAWSLALPGAAFYLTAFGTMMSFDMMFHDGPVMIVGAHMKLMNAVRGL
jgi:hypothetical protein